MSAIVPRGTYALARSPGFRRFRTFSKWYNTGRAAAPYFKMAYSAWKSRRTRKRARGSKYKNARKKLRARRSIGRPVGFSTSKKYGTSPEIRNLKTLKTLYSHPLILIKKQDGTGNRIDRRERQVVNFRGTSFCLHVENLNNIPMFLNVAVVIPKNNDFLTASIIPNTEFFRGVQNSRTQDFGTGMNFMALHCRSINTDRYRVLTHKRYKISPANSTNNAGEIVHKQYVKINRQVEFDDGDLIELPRKCAYLCWWASNASNAAQATAYNVTLEQTQYFKEPKN